MRRAAKEAVGTKNAPFIQQATLKASKKHEAQMIPSVPRWAPRTQSKNSSVARRRTPINCFTRTIQAPGFGSRRIHAGCAESNRYGEDIPAAIATNMSRIVQPEWVKAKPSAVPKNGAVQGVAKTVAKTP